MNPARSFAPSLVTGQWPSHWLYWAAPCVGALLGAAAYEMVRATASAGTTGGTTPGSSPDGRGATT